MTLPRGSAKAAREFARAVVRKKWADIVPLLSAAARARFSVDALAQEFAWEHLASRLRQQWVAATGEDESQVPELDPPRRFEIFEVEERDLPPGHAPAIPVGWVEVDFQPVEDSEFDVCYNCFLAFVNEDGPRIAAFAIENAMD